MSVIRIQCGCGSTYTYATKHGHFKTQKHRRFLGETVQRKTKNDADCLVRNFMCKPIKECTEDELIRRRAYNKETKARSRARIKSLEPPPQQDNIIENPI